MPELHRQCRALSLRFRRCGRAQRTLRSERTRAMPNDLDLRMMARCIELSRDSIAAGELPFGCVICRDEEVVTEATNRVVRDGDVTRHAEMVAMSEAQRVLGTKRLSPARCAATAFA